MSRNRPRAGLVGCSPITDETEQTKTQKHTQYMTISQLMTFFDSSSPQEMAKAIYNATECGAWVTFITPEEEIPSADLSNIQNTAPWPANNIVGIRLGSIVEGSDAEIIGKPLFCGTFEEFDLQAEIDRIEAFADELWHEANDEE